MTDTDSQNPATLVVAYIPSGPLRRQRRWSRTVTAACARTGRTIATTTGDPETARTLVEEERDVPGGVSEVVVAQEAHVRDVYPIVTAAALVGGRGGGLAVAASVLAAAVTGWAAMPRRAVVAGALAATTTAGGITLAVVTLPGVSPHHGRPELAQPPSVEAQDPPQAPADPLPALPPPPVEVDPTTAATADPAPPSVVPRTSTPEIIATLPPPTVTPSSPPPRVVDIGVTLPTTPPAESTGPTPSPSDRPVPTVPPETPPADDGSAVCLDLALLELVEGDLCIL